VAAELLVQESEPCEDDGAAAVAALCELLYGESFGAVQEKDGIEGGLPEWVCCVQGFGQGDELPGDFLVHRILRVRAEAGEEFAGKLDWQQSSVGGEGHCGIEGEKRRTVVCQKLFAIDVNELTGGSEENELLMAPGEQLGNYEQEFVDLSLDGQDDWDGVGGPGTDLVSVEQVEFGSAGIEAQCSAQRAGQIVPTKLERGNVCKGKMDMSAPPHRVAFAVPTDGTIWLYGNSVGATGSYGAWE
jgi:hypothetical protein